MLSLKHQSTAKTAHLFIHAMIQLILGLMFYVCDMIFKYKCGAVVTVKFGLLYLTYLPDKPMSFRVSAWFRLRHEA